MAASQWMTQGVSVTIRTSVPEYNAVAWAVDEPPRDGKVTLVAQVQNMEKKISVGVDKVWPATLAICDGVQTREAMDRETLNLQLDVPYHWRMEAWVFSTLHIVPGVDHSGSSIDLYLNRWIPIPGRGGNSILLRRSVQARLRLHPLVMFPRLDELRLEMWFHSVWYGESAEIMEFDILKPCPAGCIWPFCSWCQKFHLPYHGSGSHRCSRRHSRALAHLDSYRHRLEELRELLGFSVQDRWL